MATVVLVASTLLNSVEGTAYNNYGNTCWWNNATPMPITYHWGDWIQSYPQWQNAFATGVVRWNGAPVKPYFTHASDSPNSFDVYWADDNYSGFTWTWCDWQWKKVYFYAKGNLFFSVTDDWARRVAAHEQGHGLGLGHSTSCCAVMNPNNPYDTPQADDINGLNSMYP